MLKKTFGSQRVRLYFSTQSRKKKLFTNPLMDWRKANAVCCIFLLYFKKKKLSPIHWWIEQSLMLSHPPQSISGLKLLKNHSHAQSTDGFKFHASLQETDSLVYWCNIPLWKKKKKHPRWIENVNCTKIYVIVHLHLSVHWWIEYMIVTIHWWKNYLGSGKR